MDKDKKGQIQADSIPLYPVGQTTDSLVAVSIKNLPNLAIQGFNKKAEVLFWNVPSEHLFEIREEDITGKRLQGVLLTVEEEKEFSKLIKRAFQNGIKPHQLEWSALCRNGKRKHILSSVFSVTDHTDEPMALVMSLDITDRKNMHEKVKEMGSQIERFVEISAAVLSIQSDAELFDHISQAVIDISDFNRVLISYFVEKPPYREIIGYKGVSRQQVEKVKKIPMPREKYLEYFTQGVKIGNQSCYIPHTQKNILDEKAVIPGDSEFPCSDGCWHQEDNLLVAMKDSTGNTIGIISVDDSKCGLIPTDETVRPIEIFANLISEIIQRRKLTSKIKESEEKYRDLLSNIIVGIFRADPEGNIIEANPTAVEMLGYKNIEELLALNISDLCQRPEDSGRLMNELERRDFIKNWDLALQRKDGSIFWASLTSKPVKTSSDKILYYDTVIEDITKRKILQEEVKRLSITDELTGLYNRRYFNENLHEEIKIGEKWSGTLSLIMIDIDDFKPYNDTYHHLMGDEVIKEIAQVIEQSIRRNKDWASRFGGDEFIIVLPGTSGSKSMKVAERIRKTFAQRHFRPRGDVVQKTVSLGVAECYHLERKPADYKRDANVLNYEEIATELVSLADKALYKAKKSGKNKTVMADQAIVLSRFSK
jgi:diguanylate cyclase (GGDEF)-like protein/PAS domain S-box-containing protein